MDNTHSLRTRDFLKLEKEMRSLYNLINTTYGLTNLEVTMLKGDLQGIKDALEVSQIRPSSVNNVEDFQNDLKSMLRKICG